MSILVEIAKELRQARETGSPVAPLAGRWGELSLRDAYRVQRVVAAPTADEAWAHIDRLPVLGFKLGMTSRAKMQQMGVHRPIYGLLPHGLSIDDRGEVSRSSRIHPRVEPELALVLDGPVFTSMSLHDAWRNVGYACAAIELLDSRFADFKFGLTDVVADNTSASGYVLGNRRMSLQKLDVGNLGVVFERNGRVIETASTAATLDHPANAFAALLSMLAEHGVGCIPEGSVILTGGLTNAHPVFAGDHIRMSLEQLGPVELHVTV
jgi:2-oxo-3-hexenedioate decarboxylase